MGRSSTGAWTTKECKRIELKQLFKRGYFKKGYEMQGSFAWTDGSSITIKSSLSGKNSYIQLIYSITNKAGEKKDYDYKVQIVFVPSNIGKGEIMYFVCPVSRKRCRTLYKGYDCPIWKCREAYQNRIYYPGQLSSKKSRYNDRYWELEKQIKELSNQRRTDKYNGHSTKRALRLDSLQNHQNRMDELRWTFDNMPVYLQKSLQRSGNNVFH